MSHLRGRPCFLPEAATADCVSFEFTNHLERHQSIEFAVTGFIYRPHAAFPEQLQDFITAA